MADEWEKLACRLLGEVLHLIERLLLLLSVPCSQQKHAINHEHAHALLRCRRCCVFRVAPWRVLRAQALDPVVMVYVHIHTWVYVYICLYVYM